MSKSHTAKEASGAEMKSVLRKLGILAEAIGQRPLTVPTDDGEGVALETTVAVLAQAMSLIERQYHTIHKGPRFVKLEAIPDSGGRPGELYALDDRGRVFVHACNCEFGDITPWARKASEELARAHADHARRNPHHWRVLLLTPAAVSTEWFSDYVHGHALVMPLSPRVTFVGHEHAFPKDLSLSIYGEAPGFAPWRWKS
jgi:hypothetical protein